MLTPTYGASSRAARISSTRTAADVPTTSVTANHVGNDVGSDCGSDVGNGVGAGVPPPFGVSLTSRER
jgi:hypothetical protein